MGEREERDGNKPAGFLAFLSLTSFSRITTVFYDTAVLWNLAYFKESNSFIHSFIQVSPAFSAFLHAHIPTPEKGTLEEFEYPPTNAQEKQAVWVSHHNSANACCSLAFLK